MIDRSKPNQTHIHFIGIAGVGMSGIAQVLLNLGYQVSGSDLISNKATQHLSASGAKIDTLHPINYIKNAQIVVVSTAITKQNPELVYAQKHSIPVISRAEMLAELMRFRYGIAIAGTHGKTTTTSLITHILAQAGLDPTYIIGGILSSSGKNAKLGLSKYLVAEADESDVSFLHLQPKLAIITNIDNDHMATYDYDLAKLDQAFLQFIANLPFDGLCIVCIDDVGIKRIYPHINRPLLSYGFSANADVVASEFIQKDTSMQFAVHIKKSNRKFIVSANLIGKHNVCNILAAISSALMFDIPIKIITDALVNFGGVARRLERYQLRIKNLDITYFDDYGHHPNEIKAVIDGLRLSHPHKRLITIFQPHRYSRTRDLFDAFVQVLSTIDVLILLDIYPACEKPITAITSATLAKAINNSSCASVILLNQHSAIIDLLQQLVKKNNLLLTLGAGSIDKLSKQIIKTYISDVI